MMNKNEAANLARAAETFARADDAIAHLYANAEDPLLMELAYAWLGEFRKIHGKVARVNKAVVVLGGGA